MAHSISSSSPLGGLGIRFWHQSTRLSTANTKLQPHLSALYVMASVQHSVIVDDSNNNNEDVAVQIEQQPNESFRPAPPEVAVTSGNRARLLFVLGFLTVLMDLATLLYKPPRGVWFETKKLAYYLTLAGIFAAGLAEVIAAFWMCRPSSHVGGSWRRTLESVVLLASIIPFVAVIALGGFTVLVKI